MFRNVFFHKFQSPLPSISFLQSVKKTTSAQSVELRHRDPTFEKFMRYYKHTTKISTIQCLLYAEPDLSLPVSFLSKLSQRLHMNKGAPSFLQRFPHIFVVSSGIFRFTDAAVQIFTEETQAIDMSKSDAIERLQRLLLISFSHTLPLRAIFKVWRELGLPDDFEDSIISKNPSIFMLCDNPNDPNTHLLKLRSTTCLSLVPTVERWRDGEYRKNLGSDPEEIRFGFWHGFPPGMKLTKDYRARVKEWQRLPYWSPYEDIRLVDFGKSRIRSKVGKKMEKRAVAIVHEFLSLTVEKMVEVEKISQFRKWFGIDFNMRDLFLDHPGMFYLSTKGKTHTVFLREAYDRGCLIDPNPIYAARRKLLHLVMMGPRGIGCSNGKSDWKPDISNESSGLKECKELKFED